MQKSWQIHEAKNKLSAVVDEAIEHGPQILTRRGVEVAVVVSFAEYQQLRKTQTSLSEFLRQSPLAEIDLERRDADVTKRLNDLFANDPWLARDLARAANELDATGTDGSGERW